MPPISVDKITSLQLRFKVARPTKRHDFSGIRPSFDPIRPMKRYPPFHFAFLATSLILSSCAPLPSAQKTAVPGSGLAPTGRQYHGKASWYSVATNGGRTTASGEPFSNSAATAAHRSLPFGTWVKVTNLRNDRSELVRITDRGPFTRGRIIDVSRGIGKKLGMVKAGVVPARVEVMRRRR